MRIQIFCTSIKPFLLLDKLPNFISPLGLGELKHSDNWFSEKTGTNISNLNKYYGELTGFYWVWQNLMNKFDREDYIGFCHYRKLWLNYYSENKSFSPSSIYDRLLKKENDVFNTFNIIQVQPIKFKMQNLFNSFVSVHKNDSLVKSLDFLDASIAKSFFNHLNNNIFYPLNMFIVKKELFIKYCEVIFPWLEKCYMYCEKNNLLKSYNTRLPAFLAERFTSFWFSQFKNNTTLSYARLGKFFLSNRVNKFINPLKIPFTSKMYPTLHDY